MIMRADKTVPKECFRSAPELLEQRLPSLSGARSRGVAIPVREAIYRLGADVPRGNDHSIREFLLDDKVPGLDIPAPHVTIRD